MKNRYCICDNTDQQDIVWEYSCIIYIEGHYRAHIGSLRKSQMKCRNLSLWDAHCLLALLSLFHTYFWYTYSLTHTQTMHIFDEEVSFFGLLNKQQAAAVVAMESY